jgi:hypothetical protein
MTLEITFDESSAFYTTRKAYHTYPLMAQIIHNSASKMLREVQNKPSTNITSPTIARLMKRPFSVLERIFAGKAKIPRRGPNIHDQPGSLYRGSDQQARKVQNPTRKQTTATLLSMQK